MFDEKDGLSLDKAGSDKISATSAGGEILPPLDTTVHIFKSKTARIATSVFGCVGLFAFATYLFGLFVQMRGVVNLVASRLALGAAACCFMVMICIFAANLSRRRIIVAVIGCAVVIGIAFWIDRITPIQKLATPNVPSQRETVRPEVEPAPQQREHPGTTKPGAVPGPDLRLPAIQRMTNKQLRERVLAFVKEMREYGAKQGAEQESIEQANQRNMDELKQSNATSEQVAAYRERMGQVLIRLHSEENGYVTAAFVGPSLEFKSELERRLGPGQATEAENAMGFWNPATLSNLNPLNLIVMENYFERLAKALPK